MDTKDERRRRNKVSEKIHFLDDETNQSMKKNASREDKLATLKLLYDENNHKIKMPKSINYPLNYKRGMAWASHHCDNESIKFAESIIENTIYISFETFSNSLTKTCEAFVKRSANDKRKVILIIPYHIGKSNFWVTLLAYPILKDILYDIQFDVTETYNIYRNDPEGILCIICDDCIYTGSQIINMCKFSSEKIEYDNKPSEPEATSRNWLKWKTKVDDDVQDIVGSLNTDKFSINLIVPYISTLAQDRIIKYNYINVSSTIKVFKIFRNMIDISDYKGVIEEFESSFQYHSHISSIYFDHKIADAISTFNKIYLLAPIFNCGNLKKSICFIDGCDNITKSTDEIDIYQIYVNVEKILKSNSCPRTFYQTFNYTIDGKKIPSHATTSSLLNRQF